MKNIKKSTLTLIVVIALMLIGTGLYIMSLQREQRRVWDEIHSRNEAMEGEAAMAAEAAAELVPELIIEDLEEGTGRAVQSGDTISIDYVGTLLDGTEFDSSLERGIPFETQIGVGMLIEGWDVGIVGMREGGRRRLTVPAAMGYGGNAVGIIPAHSPLVFEVELHEILSSAQ
jgi:FKBP-type peptidyl-prolyl cis-trans isomerase